MMIHLLIPDEVLLSINNLLLKLMKSIIQILINNYMDFGKLISMYMMIIMVLIKLKSIS